MFCREILIAVDVQDYPTSRPWSPAELSTVDSLEAQVPDQQGKCSKDALLLLICHRKQDACEWQRVAFPRKERRQQKLLPNQCFNPPTKEKKNKFCTIRQTSSALSSDVLRIGLKEKNSDMWELTGFPGSAWQHGCTSAKSACQRDIIFANLYI